jgi:hypothetical protein
MFYFLFLASDDLNCKSSVYGHWTLLESHPSVEKVGTSILFFSVNVINIDVAMIFGVGDGSLKFSPLEKRNASMAAGPPSIYEPKGKMKDFIYFSVDIDVVLDCFVIG